MNPAPDTAPLNMDRMDSVVVRFAGDSGDGIQLTGTQFAVSTALAGHDLSTFPDFPAEIRAPAGTTFGVSAYQINFGANRVMTAGDEPDVLVAMNPAALKVNLDVLREGGLVVVDTGAFTARNLQKAGFGDNPLEDDTLARFQVIELDISALTLEAVKDQNLSNKDALRCKNMWTLGLMLWMFGRERAPVKAWLDEKFAKKPGIRDANIAALNAGHAFGETTEMSSNLRRYELDPAEKEPGTYRTVTGSEALAWGLAAGARLAGLRLFFGSYPITPASPLLHILSRLKEYNVVTFQAEDEIAAICAAIGAAYGGALGVTSSSGPGIALKTEAMGLAISAELPLVIVNSQRGGPSTGLPTKTEQSDLYQAVYGRNGDAPLPVIAAMGPGDCFHAAITAVRFALKYMTPVMLLTDGYIANAAEPWKIPSMDDQTPFPVKFAEATDGEETFNPYARDEETLARRWAKPGTPGLEHRIGGLEKSAGTGNISYDPANHQRMTDLRAERVDRIAREYPPMVPELGGTTGDIAVVGWGSTYGPIHRAVRQAREDGLKVSHIHLQFLNPLPGDLGNLLSGFKTVLVPEMNRGQLATVLRDRLELKLEQLNKVTGQPFKIREIVAAIHKAAEGRKSHE